MNTSREWKVLTSRTRLALVVLAALGSVAVQADGTLSMSYRGDQSFSLMNISEKNGVIQGDVDGDYIGLRRTSAELQLMLGNQTSTLQVSPEGANTFYNGILNGSDTVQMTSYPEKNGFRITGTLGGTDFEVDVDQKKGDFGLYWTDTQNSVDYSMNLSKTSSTEAGSCNGTMYAQSGIDSEEVAEIFCHSSGTLADTLFANPDNVIAFVIQLQVPPTDNSGNPDPQPTPSPRP